MTHKVGTNVCSTVGRLGTVIGVGTIEHIFGDTLPVVIVRYVRLDDPSRQEDVTYYGQAIEWLLDPAPEDPPEQDFDLLRTAWQRDEAVNTG